MKITEVTITSAKSLTESIDAGNTSGFLTEDLVKVAQAHEADNWTATDLDGMLQLLEEWSK